MYGELKIFSPEAKEYSGKSSAIAFPDWVAPLNTSSPLHVLRSLRVENANPRLSETKCAEDLEEYQGNTGFFRL